MKYYIICGEISGDLHAANVVKALKKIDTKAQFAGCGGKQLQAENVLLCKTLEDMSFMGITDVVKNIFKIRKNFKDVKKDILAFKPDVVIFVDYAGFNLKMAKFTKENNFKNIYYISPKIWAWNVKRVQKIKKYIDKMLCIFPFEIDFYKKFDIQAQYVGNPIVELIDKTENNFIKNKIALLPGSRTQEIKYLLPLFLEIAKQFPTEKFCIAGVLQHQNLYKKLLKNSTIEIVYDCLAMVLQQSKLALVCSGTATLETALYNVPQIVCYKTNFINYTIAKMVIKVPFISLPNLICNQPIVKELIQENCTVFNIKTQINELLQSNNSLKYDTLFTKMGNEVASKNTANLIFNYINN